MVTLYVIRSLGCVFSHGSHPYPHPSLSRYFRGLPLSTSPQGGWPKSRSSNNRFRTEADVLFLPLPLLYRGAWQLQSQWPNQGHIVLSSPFIVLRSCASSPKMEFTFYESRAAKSGKAASVAPVTYSWRLLNKYNKSFLFLMNVPSRAGTIAQNE